MVSCPPVEPAFIVGTPRSGTTLLVNLMGAHPLLAPLYETRFLRNLLELCGSACWFWGNSLSRRCARLLGEYPARSQFLKKCEKFRWKVMVYHALPADGRPLKQPYESFPFGGEVCILYKLEELVRETDLWLEELRQGFASCDSVYESARGYVDRLFSIHCARMNKPYWVNKTPGLLTYLDRLPLLYPGAWCIHILRDGRDVAASNLSLQWGPASVRDAGRRWKKLVLQGRRNLDLDRLKYRELRYEDLIESPGQVLRGIFSFLGLSADVDEILSRFKVYDQRVGAWRSAFSLEDRKIFAKEAGDLLIELGYEKDYAWVG